MLAGGMGTRLSSLNLGVPKPMVDVAGRPFLEHVLSYLENEGVRKVCMALHHKAGAVTRHFQRRWQGLRLDYSVEESPLGTGGAIRAALSWASEDNVIVVNGDTLFTVPLSSMLGFHKGRGAQVSLAVRREPRASRFGLVEFDSNFRVTRFIEKKENCGAGWINGGVYILQPKVLECRCTGEPFSFEYDFLREASASLRQYCFPHSGYFVDIGLPADLERARRDLRDVAT